MDYLIRKKFELDVKKIDRQRGERHRNKMNGKVVGMPFSKTNRGIIARFETKVFFEGIYCLQKVKFIAISKNFVLID